MIDRLFSFFQREVEAETDSTELVRLATAALMLEIARSGEGQTDTEIAAIIQRLDDTHRLDADRSRELLEVASAKVEDAHDLYQFTRVINEHFDYAAKRALVNNLWQVAFADGRIEAIEDHIIRRVAGLLHLSHDDFIQEKIRARGRGLSQPS